MNNILSFFASINEVMKSSKMGAGFRKGIEKVLFVIIMSLLAIPAVADPVTPERACAVAQRFVASAVKADMKQIGVVYTRSMPESKGAAFYVVNVGDGAFVIVAGDDAARPVLGYSTSRAFPQKVERLPDNVDGWFAEMARQVAFAAEHQEGKSYFADQWERLSPSKEASKAPSNQDYDPLPTPQAGPLLTTTWDQGQYYNALCPSYDGINHTPTGCVATAMAQIINYWGYPIHGRGSHSYESNYGTLTVNYDSATYNYTQMPALLTSSSTTAEVAEVSKLMYHCGVSVSMDYNPGESSSYRQAARTAFVDNFNYVPSLSWVEKNQFSNAEWMTLMETDLDQNHPILYSGHGSGGHTFVCDGYNDSNFFHFNWGWSGNADGWFALTVLNPYGFDFSSNQDAVIGIRPNTDTESSVVYGKMSGASRYTVTRPTTFYHTMGNNGYEGVYYNNPCYNTVTFYAQDDTSHLVLDILEMVDQNLMIYDGDYEGVLLRNYWAGNNVDMSPIVSSSNALTLVYGGSLYYGGFAVRISEATACRAPSNLYAIVDTTTVHLIWEENGAASQWQIEYGPEGFAHGEGTLLAVSTNPCDIVGLPVFQPQDFYVRSVCGIGQYGLWSGKLTITPEARYWDEVVTEQPEGYIVNSNGSVTVTTAEGLTWWVKQGAGSNLSLGADINLSGYKWRPIPSFNYTFNGNGHTIYGINIKETSPYVGFFSRVNGHIVNLVLNLMLIHFHSILQSMSLLLS